MLAPAAADSVLELDNVVHGLICFCFFLLWKVFAFVFSVLLMPPSVAWTAASALIPMAQMKPSSSRPIAVMVFLWSLPRAINVM